jgi:hypothetical protein
LIVKEGAPSLAKATEFSILEPYELEPYKSTGGSLSTDSTSPCIPPFCIPLPWASETAEEYGSTKLSISINQSGEDPPKAFALEAFALEAFPLETFASESDWGWEISASVITQFTHYRTKLPVLDCTITLPCKSKNPSGTDPVKLAQ